jgi:putative ABC transport system substrate-binding protein
MIQGLKRREFITLLGGTAAAASISPFGAQAQQVKRFAMLINATTDEPEQRLPIFMEALRKQGWIEGRNIEIEVRLTGGDASIAAAHASDLVRQFKPDVLLAHTTANLVALQRATSTIPIIFMIVSDPVAQGFVPNLSRPGGNITGFAAYEFSIAGKWADLLKQMAPSITNLALVLNPDASPQFDFFFSSLQAAAASLGVAATAVPFRSSAELEAAIERLARAGNVGLIFPTSTFSTARTRLILDMLAQHRLPAIFAENRFAAEGGLMSYVIDLDELFRLAPYYVDRILKGTKPADFAGATADQIQVHRQPQDGRRSRH